MMNSNYYAHVNINSVKKSPYEVNLLSDSIEPDDEKSKSFLQA